jgi:hypothetical protein
VALRLQQGNCGESTVKLQRGCSEAAAVRLRLTRYFPADELLISLTSYQRKRVFSRYQSCNNVNIYVSVNVAASVSVSVNVSSNVSVSVNVNVNVSLSL